MTKWATGDRNGAGQDQRPNEGPQVAEPLEPYCVVVYHVMWPGSGLQVVVVVVDS